MKTRNKILTAAIAAACSFTAQADYQVQIPLSVVATAAPTGGGTGGGGTPPSGIPGFLRISVQLYPAGWGGGLNLSHLGNLTAVADCDAPPQNGMVLKTAPFVDAQPAVPTGNFWGTIGSPENLDFYGDAGVLQPNYATNWQGPQFELCIPGDTAQIDAFLLDWDQNGPPSSSTIVEHLYGVFPGAGPDADVSIGHVPITLGATTWHVYGFSYDRNGGGGGATISVTTSDQPATLTDTLRAEGGTIAVPYSTAKTW